MSFAVYMLSLAAAPATAPTPPLGINPPAAGPRTQMLNLGSPHLSESAHFRPTMLDGLIDRLASFRPTIITIEGVSGEQCEMMRRSPRYAEAVKSYCFDPSAAQTLVGLSRSDADTQADTLLRRWEQSGAVQPGPAERRRAALLLLAAGEPMSAAVQWLSLPASERRAADGLDAAMVKVLNRDGRPMNENYYVGARLAARLGLQRVYAVDDHTSDGALSDAGEAYGKAIGTHFEGIGKLPLFAQYSGLLNSVQDSATMLALYANLNSPKRLKQQITADFGGAISSPAAAPYGRQYGAWWDTRNLRMVSNIRAVTVGHPGARVLNIVGASHRPWYDQLLGQMPDVTIVPVQPFLAPAKAPI